MRPATTLLELRALGALVEPLGFRTLADFLVQIDRGSIPRNETTIKLALAFAAILEGSNPAKELELSRSRGRPAPSIGTLERDYKRFAPLCEFMAATLPDGKKKRGQRSQALDAASKKFGYQDVRSVERAWLRWKPTHDLLIRIKEITGIK